jgi:hypothetical protein
MRIWTSLAVLAAIVGGIVFTSLAASAWTNCTTNCNSYGNQTTCTRSCF